MTAVPTIATFENSFALLDAETRLIDWDEGFAREWDEVAHLIYKGASFAEIAREIVRTHPELRVVDHDIADPVAFLNERTQAIGTERSFDYRSLSGRIIHVEETRTLQGGLLRLARDVSDERVIRRALTEARQQLDAAGPAVTGAFLRIIRNPDGSYTFPPISDSVRKVLDLPPDFVGRDAMTVHARMNDTADDSARMAAALEHSARTLDICTLEYSVWSGAGQLKRVRQSLMPRREADGTVVFSGVLRDVTQEREAQEQIELLRSVVVRSSDAIIVFETSASGESKVLYVNPKFEQLAGPDGAGLRGASSDVLFAHPLTSDSKALADALRSADGSAVELEAVGPDGQSFWMEARAETIQRLANGGYRWAVISRDITDRRRSQEQLLRAKEDAEAGNRAKSHFLATMSHELRTPLNAIIGFSEILLNGLQNGGWEDAYRVYVTDISESGRQLLGVINTVLDLSKIEAGSIEIDLEPVGVAGAVEAATALLSGMAGSAGVALTVTPIAPGLEALGDPLRLKQVLLNILSNAIKFTPSGGHVTVCARAAAGRIEIAIADTGCGIAAVDLERVMLPFVQVETSLSRKHPGTGLGLAIAKSLCQLQNGALRIESAPDAGTTVTIDLPAAPPRQG